MVSSRLKSSLNERQRKDEKRVGTVLKMDRFEIPESDPNSEQLHAAVISLVSHQVASRQVQRS